LKAFRLHLVVLLLVFQFFERHLKAIQFNNRFVLLLLQGGHLALILAVHLLRLLTGFNQFPNKLFLQSVMNNITLAPVNMLVSLTWLLWALRSFRRFTLHYITTYTVSKHLQRLARKHLIPLLYNSAGFSLCDTVSHIKLGDHC